MLTATPFRNPTSAEQKLQRVVGETPTPSLFKNVEEQGNTLRGLSSARLSNDQARPISYTHPNKSFPRTRKRRYSRLGKKEKRKKGEGGKRNDAHSNTRSIQPTPPAFLSLSFYVSLRTFLGDAGLKIWRQPPLLA